jgi:nucleoside-diphosphate-sugar epimerase
MNQKTKPGMIITGATGFLGSRLVEHLRPQYRIYAIGQRPQVGRRTPTGPGVHYYQVDIGRFEPLREVFEHIRHQDDVEIVLHLAGYYDFSGDENPLYEHSNVLGTRNVLELSAPLKPKRFFFTSSVAACPFPPPGEAITERTPPTAPPPYSRSKRAGEEMMHEYKDRIPGCILRLAAIFSDWCEYEPLNVFLATWFSGGWNARILGGHGQWAVPYLHVRDLLRFYLTVIEKCTAGKKPLSVLQASPNGCTTHLELYQAATQSYFGSARRSISVPKPLARTGIFMRETLGRLTGRMPFERSWMGEYIDQKLNVDASETHRLTGWKPRPELDILKCIPTMVENMKNDPEQWEIRYQLARKGKQKMYQTAEGLVRKHFAD